jgi:hypothetical protein
MVFPTRYARKFSTGNGGPVHGCGTVTVNGAEGVLDPEAFTLRSVSV